MGTWEGGLLSPEKGTSCGPTSQELSPSRAKMATKRGAVQSQNILPEGSCHSLNCKYCPSNNNYFCFDYS